MHIDYQISEDDFVSAGRLFIKTRRARSFYRRVLVPVLWIIMCLSVTISIWLAQDRVSQLPFALILLLPLCRLLIPWQLRRQYRKAPIFHDRKSIDLDANQIHMRSSFSESTTTWEPFIRFAENSQTFILVQQGDLMFYPIPKRELTPAQITELRSLLEAHLARK